MRKFLVLFLILIQSLFISASAGQTDATIHVLNKHTHYIQASKEFDKKNLVNLKLCNGVIKCLNSKAETIFAYYTISLNLL